MSNKDAAERTPDVQTVKQKAKQSEEQPVAQRGQVVYIGPNMLARGLKAFTIYKESPTEMLKELREKYPLSDRLFVPVEELSGALAKVNEQGTPIFIAYNEILGGVD
ncbi:hypothetical protein [Selenomonas artemidis]|jgi:hypothetical protein|uniref:hypothetical protein n=1 Tax=Selenomonas artemidis TaxID=671224 RepID=UPI00205E3F53|nr:hypothetical protein [Selenomonas artemidis]DAF35362.1 MAG TPA: hypothetical protein [Caudoviricetes sp.]